ncbi:MAG: undecaprenyl-diphosphate phosphatase [Luminiphilus sp.]|jgi:undecaprenyl-diphosphatase|nr:undecaprenyl-diphosphate phosphatase [Luminiphilus sp.]
MTDWLQVLLLSLIQGVTEFLPVSSSAHLILTSELMAWNDQGLLFDVCVHTGTLMAVLFYFRTSLWGLLGELLPGGSAGRSELWSLIIATVPVMVAGGLLKHAVAQEARNVAIIGGATLFFGLLLGLSNVFSRRRATQVEQVTYRDALLIGLAQTFALIPGASRSGVTITAALFLGYHPAAATRFSFLLSIPVIVGATVLMLPSVTGDFASAVFTPLLVGFSVSAFVAYITIGLFMQMVVKIGLMPFVIYRLLLGVALLVWAVP